MVNNKYDIGVFGVWYGMNYGSVATYYALNTLLTSMGKTVLMLDKPIMGKEDIEVGDTHARRFAKKHYNISERYELKDFQKLNDQCDVFLIGSDQLWNYGISRGTGKTFYLDFVRDEKKKISFATSFGHAVDFAPPAERKKIAALMARFDGVSLREDDGVEICRRDYGINARQVLDPVYMVDRKTYQPLIDSSDKGCNEPYLLTYILDPTPEKKAAILHIAKKLGGVKIINVLDGFSNKFEKNKAAMGLPNCIEGVQTEDWLKYISEAEFVITDSFHGMSFSIIFQKPFIAICNKSRCFSRFQSLSRLFNIGDHVVAEAKQIIDNPKLLAPIDYNYIDHVISVEREKSYTWLEIILNSKKKTKSQLIEQNIIGTVIPKAGGNTVTSNLDSKMCIGCGACVSVCPQNAVSIRGDEWGYYRSAINYDVCVECGRCVDVCPALELPKTENNATPKCYEFVSSDPELLKHSSSGGIFTTLAKQIISEGGIVCGAAWAEEFTVKHIMIESEDDLWKLQKSKYVQSYVGDTFKHVKNSIKDGRKVMFTGTPCQTAGLRKYLGKDAENLLLVDILCSNAPSAMFFKKYIEDTYGPDLASYEFRYKSDDVKWDCFHTKATLAQGEQILHNGPSDDNYQRVFHNHVMCPYHCENCRYQSFPRMGDLTIGDFWGISRFEKDIDVSKGVSLVLCNNDKGQKYLDSLDESSYSRKKEVPLSWMGGNGFSNKGGKNYASPKRDIFYKEILKRSFGDAVNYVLKPNHGIYRDVYRNSNSALQFDVNMLHFHFERNIWEEVSIEGRPTLIVKEGMWKENGHYARLSLNGMLKKDKQYKLAAKFRIKSQSPILNFHIIDSGSKQLQIIHTERIAGRNTGEHWIEFNKDFVPNTDYYDEFMFGAAQVSGPNNYLMIAYINISEV